jgi:flagellar motor switch protein FliG
MPEPAIGGDHELTGPEKAAALLLTMGKPPAARLLKQFDELEVRTVARAAAGLGAIPAATLDRLVDEFAADFAAGADLLGGAGQVKNLLADALPPEQIADIFGGEQDKPRELDAWRRLAQAPEAAIVALLLAEQAETATYILSRLDPEVATKIIAALPRDRRNAALCGLAAPLDATPLVARLIEEALGQALKQAPKSAAGAEGRARLANIINGLDPDEAQDAMRALELARPKDAEIVKTMLFSFNDLPRLSERARALLFDRASIDIVVMALRGTDAEFRDTVLSSMPSRGRRLVEGELSSGASAPPRDVAKARKAIAEIVLGMASRNEIELGGPSGAESP